VSAGVLNSSVQYFPLLFPSPPVSHSLRCMRALQPSKLCQVFERLINTSGRTECTMPRTWSNKADSTLASLTLNVCSLLEYSSAVYNRRFCALYKRCSTEDCCKVNGLRPKASDGCLWSRMLGRSSGYGHGCMALSSTTMLVTWLLLCRQPACRCVSVNSLGQTSSALKQCQCRLSRPAWLPLQAIESISRSTSA
jgi:hypothetical protein